MSDFPLDVPLVYGPLPTNYPDEPYQPKWYPSQTGTTLFPNLVLSIIPEGFYRVWYKCNNCSALFFVDFKKGKKTGPNKNIKCTNCDCKGSVEKNKII